MLNDVLLDTLIVDTGSSNTWVGANDANPYKESSSSVDTLEELVCTRIAVLIGFAAYLSLTVELLAYGSGFMIGTGSSTNL